MKKKTDLNRVSLLRDHRNTVPSWRGEVGGRTSRDLKRGIRVRLYGNALNCRMDIKLDKLYRRSSLESSSQICRQLGERALYLSCFRSPGWMWLEHSEGPLAALVSCAFGCEPKDRSYTSSGKEKPILHFSNCSLGSEDPERYWDLQVFHHWCAEGPSIKPAAPRLHYPASKISVTFVSHGM